MLLDGWVTVGVFWLGFQESLVVNGSVFYHCLFSIQSTFNSCILRLNIFTSGLTHPIIIMSNKLAKLEEKTDYIFKYVILGDSAVGKTNLLLRFTQEDYKPTHLPTIGVDFKIKIIDVKGQKVKLQLWDTAGQERFRTITETYYKNATGIILVYSVGERKTFGNISNWINQIAERQSEDVPKILVGNKCDLSSKERCVSYAQGKELADRFRLPFMEVSAKENVNVEAMFTNLTERVIQFSNSKIQETIMGNVLEDLEAKRRKSGNNSKKNCCSH